MMEEKIMGASATQTGLGAPEGAEPHSGLGATPAIPSAEPYTSVDDEETRAFIDGWNARLRYDDFDMALHFWNRARCGI